MELDCVSPLKTLLNSSTPAWTESAITLLSTLSAHPPNNVSKWHFVSRFSFTKNMVYGVLYHSMSVKMDGRCIDNISLV